MTITPETPDPTHIAATKAALEALANNGDEATTTLGGQSVRDLSLNFAQRVFWLRKAGLRDPASDWGACLTQSGWRSLVVGDGSVIGAITTWMIGDVPTWSAYWGGWARTTSDAVLIASQRKAVVETDLEPIFLRVLTLGQGAIWLRPRADKVAAGTGIVIPLPNARPPLQSLTLMTPEQYLDTVRNLTIARYGWSGADPSA